MDGTSHLLGDVASGVVWPADLPLNVWLFVPGGRAQTATIDSRWQLGVAHVLGDRRGCFLMLTLVFGARVIGTPTGYDVAPARR